MNIDTQKIDRLVGLVRQRFPQWSNFSDPAFEAQEVTYKQDTIKKAQELLSAEELQRLIDKQDYDEVIDRVDKIGKDNNLLYRSIPMQGDLQILYQKKLSRAKFCTAFQDLIYGNDAIAARFDAWVSFVDKEQLPNYWTFPTYFLFIFHPQSEIFVKPRTTKWLLEFLGQDAAIGRPANWQTYSRIRDIAASLREGLKVYGPRDIVDIQSLIWVCASEKDNNPAGLAEPFCDIFESRSVAEWAFGFLKETLGRLGVKGTEDTRVALTLPKGENILRLNYGQWIVASFFGESDAPNRAEITLLAGLMDLPKKGKFTTKKDEPDSCIYGIPIEQLRAMDPKLRSAMDKSLDFIASRFKEKGQEMCGYRNFHQPKLMEMVFDNEKRARYLTEGLNAQSDTSYWKIAPGDHGWQWEECRKDHFIAIGWDAFGDLSGVSRAEYEKRLAKLLPKHSDWTEIGCEQLWKFSQIKKGDRIVANKGTTEVLGIGTVTGPYFFVPGVDFGHRLPVTWDDVRPRQVEKGGWKRTLISLSEEDFNAILNALPAADPVEATPFESSASNTILYGPPGTGKTYKTIERAVQIIDPDFKGNNHAAYKARFDVLRAKGQIEFITFHQSYSYEDFVEGLRPVLDDQESSVAAYEHTSGVFKSLALQALYDCLKPTIGNGSFDTLWDKLVEQIQLEPDKEYPGLTEKSSFSIALTSRDNIVGKNTVSQRENIVCARSMLQKVYLAKSDKDKISVSDVMEVVERGCQSNFIAAMFNELKRIEKVGLVGIKKSGSSKISKEQKERDALAFLEKDTTTADAFKPASEWPQYVLVIDEINRGNMSKILGELITLIEPDKRLGAENSLVVTLPYTKQPFAVPVNLHILGTMNTADKSIALVDVALRRRFEFVELRPDFTVCKKLSPQMREVLETLNRRICLRKDRDHQIGHSYFKKVDDESAFNQVFAGNVIPLLQEYFYNDWDGLRFVLGEKNKKSGDIIVELKDADSGDSRSSWQWSFEAGNNDIKKVNFLQLLGDKEPAA